MLPFAVYGEGHDEGCFDETRRQCEMKSFHQSVIPESTVPLCEHEEGGTSEMRDVAKSKGALFAPSA